MGECTHDCSNCSANCSSRNNEKESMIEKEMEKMKKYHSTIKVVDIDEISKNIPKDKNSREMLDFDD